VLNLWVDKDGDIEIQPTEKTMHQSSFVAAMELMVVAVLFYSIGSLQRLILLSNRTADIATCSLIQ
jgi:hypothetical protein